MRPVQVGPASFKLSQQSNIHFITYYSCKYFHTVSSLRLHFFSVSFHKSSQGLDKYHNKGDTLLLHCSPNALESP